MKTTPPKLPVVIFDWDDTLLNAGHILRTAQRQAITSILQEQKKYPFTKNWQCPTFEVLQTYTGHRFKEVVILQIFPQIDTNNTIHQLWLADIYQRFLQFYKKKPKKLFPGIPTMLQALKSNGHILCIATNKSRHLLDNELEETNIAPLFTHTVTADDTQINGQGKPKPTMINLLQSHFPPSTLFVMVGDQNFDIEATQASQNAHNTMTIGITGDNTLRLHIADLRLNSASSICTEKIKILFNPTL